MPTDRNPRLVRSVAVVLVLALVALSPWPFGSSNPSGQFVVSLVVLALVGLWTAYAVMTRRFSYRADPVSLCLAGLVLVTAFQLVPLPPVVHRVLSPTAAQWHRALLPAEPELLPGESAAEVPARGQWARLTVARSATEDLLVQFLAVFLVYSAARNFAIDRSALARLAWVGFATGTALALIALAQHLSGERERIYWTYDTGGPVFGSFVNKNHFAFQIHLFAGLGIGLYLEVARREGVHSPAALGLLGGLGLMLAAVGFSQSRGGVVALVASAVLTWAIARAARTHANAADRRIGLALLGGAGLVALALIAWLGWADVFDRLATFWQGTADNRTPVWRRAWPLVQQFPLAGVGGGGYPAAEMATRTHYDGTYLSTTAHNEYLEALIEGGVVRFGLTVALAIVAVWCAARRYWQTQAPLFLGCTFGLGAVAIHSIGDFGLHVPSVALSAAVVAAYSAGPREKLAAPEADVRPTDLWLIIGKSALLVLAAGVVVLGSYQAYRVDVLRAGAASTTRPEDAVLFLEAAARVRPNDPEIWEALANTRMLLATEQTQSALGAAAGFAAFASLPDELVGEPGGQLWNALRAVRAGRDVQPLSPGPHLRLGAFARHLARTEPAPVHFDRAKLVSSFEPDVWYVCGQAAANRGDWPVALADWHESLARSPRRLAAIARHAAGTVRPVEFREKVLPDSPAMWYAVAPQLFPERGTPGRAEWMRAIAARCSRAEPHQSADFIAWGSALEELGDAAGAARVWRTAAARFPERPDLRSRLAASLESQELYEEALPVLEALTAERPDDGNYRLRLAATRHALKLKALINDN